MDCNHEQVRCTNNVFYCLKCGIEVPSPYQMDKQSTEKKTAQEAGKRAVKRRTRKGESE